MNLQVLQNIRDHNIYINPLLNIVSGSTDTITGSQGQFYSVLDFLHFLWFAEERLTVGAESHSELLNT